jgi:peptidoglycan/LPS O-acetylase OafA/YrhL
VAGDGASRGKAGRFDCFDGLRAIAALSVLMLHVSWDSGFTIRSWFGLYTARLDIGVAVFFLISGFLLYRPFAVAHFRDSTTPSWKRFWVRRALRIFPAYWAALTLLTYAFHLAPMGPGIAGVVSHYGLLQIYWPTQSFFGIPQAWSLATEISFYLLLPFYAAALTRRGRPARRQLWFELGGVVVLLGISNVFRWWVLNIPWIVFRDGKFMAACAPNCATDPTLGSLMVTWLPAYLDLFGLGMLLAVGSAWWVQRGREPRWLSWRATPYVSWALALGTYIVVVHLPITRSPLYFTTPPTNILRQALYGVFAFFLIVPAVFGQARPSLLRTFLRSRPMMGLGLVSYGIYLWHLNLADALVSWMGYKLGAVPMPLLAVTTIGLSVAAATASYLIVERPMLRLKPRGPSSQAGGSPTATTPTRPVPAVVAPAREGAPV